jgi:hypothetical protein
MGAWSAADVGSLLIGERDPERSGSHQYRLKWYKIVPVDHLTRSPPDGITRARARQYGIACLRV